MDSDNNKRAARGFKREEGQPKNGLSDDLPYRIAGLEKAKLFPDMSPQDIAALDRMIEKLKLKLAEKNPVKTQEKDEV
jgi:hypothetical protein